MSVKITVASTRSPPRTAVTGEELLDLVDDLVGAAGPRKMVGAGQLDVARPVDVLGDIAPERGGSEQIAGAMDDKGRDGHLREAVADIRERRHRQERPGAGRARAPS